MEQYEHMNNYTLSIIVASYNYENYIGMTLQSLVDQSAKDIEIIVVDDGSKDSSLEVIKSYCGKYPNVKLFQHENGANKGLAETMKLGIRKSSGEYICFCESDDYWDIKHAEKILSFIDKNRNAGFIVNSIKVVDENSRPYGNSMSFYNRYVENCHRFLKVNNGKNIFRYLTRNHIPTFGAVCLRKELLLQSNFDSYHPPYLDLWLWRQVAVRNKVYFVPDAVTYWRKHTGSYSRKNHTNSKFLLAGNDIILKNIDKDIPLFVRLKLWWHRRKLNIEDRNERNKFIKYQIRKIRKIYKPE